MGLQDRLSKPAANGATAVVDVTAPTQATPRDDLSPGRRRFATPPA